MSSGPLVARLIASRSGGMHGDQLATVDDDLVDRLGDPILETLDLDLGEMKLLVRIEQIRQPVRSKPDPAKHPVVQAVGNEANERRVRYGVWFEDLLGRGLEDEVQAT